MSDRSLESLLAELRARRGAGEDVDLEEVCRQHPEHAEELRRLYDDWVRLEDIGRLFGLSGLSRRLRSLLGPDLDPRVELEEEDPAEFTEKVLGRLSDRAPSSSRYHLKGEVARGGMGAVLRVWDEDLRRHLAMKVLLGRGEAEERGDTPPVDSGQLARFLEEAQVTGQLDHPGIVPVHELGLDDVGRVFFTMKLVKGRTLGEVFHEFATGEGGWTQTGVLGLIAKVCEAMSYAHDKRVIHRDLKPANVMVGRYGEVYVMDWGLAKILGREDGRDLRIRPPVKSTLIVSDRHEHADLGADSPLYTMDGDIVGTPAYMPPEQAGGRIGEMGPASDVYAVGAMLYHLLAHQMPYVPEDARVSPYALLVRVQEGPPRPLHLLAPDAPTDLVAICEKAMRREVADRYPDMQALGADISAYIEGRVVRAYEAGAWAEARKWVKRNRSLAAALAAALVLALGGAGGMALVQAEGRRAADEQRAIADEQADIATARADDVLRLSALQDLEELLVEAEAHWPPHPEVAGPCRAWIERSLELVAELPRHRARCEELREAALPRTEEERLAERADHPEAARFAALSGEVDARRRALVRRRDGVDVELPAVRIDELPSEPAALNALAWKLVDPEREAFGEEPRGLALAQRALALAGDDPLQRATIGDTLAWARFALGRDEEALAAAEDALAAAPSERREELAGFTRRLEEAVAAASGTEGLELAARDLAELEGELSALDAELDRRRVWRFEREHSEAAWWNAQLTKLIDGLEALEDDATGLLSPSGLSAELGWSVPRRLAFAERMRGSYESGGDFARRWEAALPEIEATVPGLEPQMGLVPIGVDPNSGLWEFWHVASGDEPERGADGRLRPTHATGVVLVLLPGGTFGMGAQSDPTGPNSDPEADRDESPVHDVTLSPFFVSKYELTQGQWARLHGSNPSEYGPDSAWHPEYLRGGAPPSLLHPVEMVSWDDATAWALRAGLALPTEAQWEYACRAGTDTVWWSGSERESLQGVANLNDRYARDHGRKSWSHVQDWLDDGAAVHTPVGTYAANAFGLHDVHGNVWEWCLDGYQARFYAHGPDEDPVFTSEASPTRVIRGGAYSFAAYRARSAGRRHIAPTNSGQAIGLRPARGIDGG